MLGAKKIGLSLAVLLGVFTLGYGVYSAYTSSPQRRVPIVYSENAMLLELWSDYKENAIEPGTNRTLDKQQNNITTSEGQSYSMLRSVWMDDKETFDQSWQWTKDNLQREDSLMSWKFGERPDGSYGIQDTVGGQNTATDGDSDIALSLLMAYRRWNESAYLYEAQPIIKAIWAKEVVSVQGKPVLVANDIEHNDPNKVIVNPSYLSPYAYKIFAKVDPRNDWIGLANSSYELLDQVISQKLGSKTTTGLVPDWVEINRKTGDINASRDGRLTTNYGYDAMRTSWRLALDWDWYEDQRAKQILNRFSLLSDQWDKEHKLATTYAHDGRVVDDYESPAVYGGSIGYFKIMKPDQAKDIYDKKLLSLYDPDNQKWKQEMNYYDDNWAWFGMALMEDALPNLTL